MERNLHQLVEAIDQRHSVRTYENVSLTREMLVIVREYVEAMKSQFGDSITIALIEKNRCGEQVKLGTYGVIKGAENFLAIACKSGVREEITLGYAMEKVVLFCTSIGLGTVWLGGSYKKSDFAAEMELREGEEIRIVIPFGYEAEKKSFFARLAGKHSKKRKAFGRIYFDQGVKTSLKEDKAGKYKEALNKMRSAPSSFNKQPWRVIKEQDMLHFYVTELKGNNAINLGIALAHFYLTAELQGIEGEFIRKTDVADKPFTYVVSWVEKIKK